MKKFLGAVKETARPWWNQRLARTRFSRLKQFLSDDPELNLVAYDIGARWGISPPYDRLRDMPGFHSVGFEPDEDEASQLQKSGAFSTVCPRGLGERRETRRLNIARDPGCSTLYVPDITEFARHTSSRQFETVSSVEIGVAPLDDVIAEEGLPLPDYMKIDCEGAELEILEGASATLPHICGLTFEARILDLYRGGATLGGLLDFLFERGFICLKMPPVGAFFGSVMMFDVTMVRHPESLHTRRSWLLGILFCLLHDNWQYAHHIAESRSSEFDGKEVVKLLKR